MKRLVAMAVAAGAVMVTAAMPTKKELQKAQAMVSDVTAADVKALKAKTKTPAEVAARHMELAGQAGSEAEKYLLLQGAFKLYAKAGDYDAAANVIEKLQAEISDYAPEITVELCGAEFIRKMRENAPRLYALKENARRIVFYRKQLPIREAAVKKNPKDVQAQRKLAECHAELGNWPKALEVFVKAGGEFKKISEGETSGKVPAQELGDFWWDYETKSDTFVYKLHAAELYRKALADDSFKGLARTRTEQRVKEAEESEAIFCVKSSSNDASGDTLVVPSVSYKGGEMIALTLNGNGRNVSFEFSACPPGEFEMNGNVSSSWSDKDAARAKKWWSVKHSVKITYPFLIMQGPLSYSEADALDLETAKKGRAKFSPGTERIIADSPVMELSWDDIQVLLAKMNEKMRLPPRLRRFAGYEFRLPTEAEWRYAMRGGSDAKDWGATSDWCKEWAGYWWGKLPKGSHFPFAPVSSMKKTRNPWGLYYLGPKTIYADTFPGEYVKGAYDGTKDLCYVGQDIFKYAEKEVDPVRIFKGDDFSYLVFYAGRAPQLSPRNRDVQNAKTPIRFVFAPKLSLLNVYPRTANDGPVKRIGEEQSTAETIATGQATTSGNAPTPKCKMVNGRPAPLKFELAKGVDLELEGCPAGTFTMGYDFRPEGGWNSDGKAAPKHAVVITRPFWVGKYQVTREQLNVLGLGQVMDEQMRSALNSMDGRGGARCAAACSVADSEYFCRKLTEKFRDQLPIGYVFRLPTDAEWEYASKAGNYLKSNPAMAYGVPGKFFVGSALYADVRKELIQKAMKWDGRVPPGPVGTKSPNDWGVYDAVGNGDELMLDRLPCLDGDIIRCDKTYKHVVVYLQPAKDKADPLHYQDGSDYYCLVRAETLTKFIFKVGAERPATFRLCLGPDLVAEKKAKGK